MLIPSSDVFIGNMALKECNKIGYTSIYKA
jgi:hypothetical protein